ncbi:hypothetical protein MMC10_007537 [Thelotrema lepadinum]|nr:hypothetical protein [Thelotrema lepadinum]
MQRTDQDFKDGLALDLFSPTERSLVVQKNETPLPGNLVSGSSGEPFMALSPYSWVIEMNESAKDLIAKVEVPYVPDELKKQGIDQANTYVGTLAPDGKSWVVSEPQRNVHAEFIDGLRFSVETASNMTMNVDIPNGIEQSALPNGTQSLNSFVWRVNTSAPQSKVKATMLFPINLDMLKAKLSSSASPDQLSIASRASNSSVFKPISAASQKLAIQPETRIQVQDLAQLDGDYIILVKGAKSSNGTGSSASNSSTSISSSTGKAPTMVPMDAISSLASGSLVRVPCHSILWPLLGLYAIL